ncbi:DUF418 domain-containing protein [Alkalibacillus aidingensis]|uniref:DUF418 domain-containing protein n=1 Tax=Alkalibacillus aidingensis TaxID=2747607 RepID=UPI00166045D1|nr:DUF418 domain-containing protein [Alkalibacillus aidingensis]
MKEITGTRKRIISLDAIRGFALFGILMVNILAFHSPHFLYGGASEFYQAEWDGPFLVMIDLFFQASFYPLFSLLFGIGMYLMYERLQQSVQNEAKKVLRRRMFVLALIGLAHGLFIWYGDILLTYSIVGLFTLLFIHKSVKSLVKWAASMLLITTLLLTFMYYQARDFVDGYQDHGAIRESFAHYLGSYSDILSRNFTDWLIMFDPFQIIIITLTILPMFLTGIIIVKLGWLKDIEGNLKQIRMWLGISFIIFALFKIGPYAFGMPAWMDFMQDTIGGSFSSIFYLLLLLILFEKRYFFRFQRIMSGVGKLSLTNYLMQSVICFLIFYGVGLGWYGELTVPALVALALLIYSMQALFSHWYLSKYQYGPFEWIYRSLTYGRKQAFKRRA